MTDPRAVRYRRLALVEKDPETARLLRLLADEAEQGILCVSSVPKPIGSCPLAWCSWRWVTAIAGMGRAGQLAIAGRLTVGSSLNGAMVSSVM